MNLAGWLPTQSLFSTGATHSANPILPPDLLLNNGHSTWEGKMFPAVKPAWKWGSFLFTYLVQTSSTCNIKWLIVVKRESQDLPCSQPFSLWPGQAGKQNRWKHNMLKEKEPTLITFTFIRRGMDSSVQPHKYHLGVLGEVGNRVVKYHSNIENTFHFKHSVIRTGIIKHNPMADSFLTKRGERGWSTNLGNRDVAVKKRGRRRRGEAEGIHLGGYVSFQQWQENLLFLGQTTLSPVQQTAGKRVCTVPHVFPCISVTQQIITSYCYLTVALHCGLEGLNLTDNTSQWRWKKISVWFHTLKRLSFTSSVSENLENYNSWKELEMHEQYCI